ncbi:MAG: ferrous iron transport protein A [Clostridiales bacterium]|nr:ferrous iron transport protein A [Clostridiales bacterium]
MNLIDGEKGFVYKVKSINLDERVKRRFEILGMIKDTDILILNKKRNGSIIIKLRGTRFAIGKNFAEGVEIGGESD